jgi:hypothetical protein
MVCGRPITKLAMQPKPLRIDQSIQAVLRIAACLTAATMAACAGPTAWPDSGRVYADQAATASVSQPADGTARVIVFQRERSDAESKPANVYLDNRYLSTVLAGAFTEQTVCAGSVQLATVVDDARLAHTGRNDNMQRVALSAGSTHYFEVISRNASSTLLQASSEADWRHAGGKRQVHALSRVPSCKSSSPAKDKTASR